MLNMEMTTKNTGTDTSRLFYGYVIVAATFFIQFITLGTYNSVGVFFNPLLTEFEWPRAVISGAMSLSFLLYGLLSIPLGSLNDRFGPRLIIACCGCLLGIGYFLTSKINAVWHLYLFFGVLVGSAQSSMDVIPLSTIARWFTNKRGMMSGILKAGTGFGMLIMPIFITWLMTSYGWRLSFAALGAINLVSVVTLSLFLVRDPAKMGLFADNKKAPNETGLDSGEAGLAFSEAIRTRQFWTICFVYSLVIFCLATILMHIVQHTIDLGISATKAANILSIIGASSIGGRLVMGAASDRVGNKIALTFCLLFLLAGLTLLQFSFGFWMFCLFATVHGFAHGGFFSLNSPIIAWLFGMKSHGLLFGILIFISTIGGSIGPILAGYLFDRTESYQALFLILTGLTIIGLIATISLKAVPYSDGH
ncbi:MFS transporter [Thermodesulfobacteriota bacterium]